MAFTSTTLLLYVVLFHDETQEQEEGNKQINKITRGGSKVSRLVVDSRHFMAMCKIQ